MSTTKVFGKPEVGRRVRVVTRWKEIWYWATKPYRDYIKIGEVIPSASYDNPDTFRIFDELRNEVSVVPLPYVVQLSNAQSTYRRCLTTQDRAILRVYARKQAKAQQSTQTAHSVDTKKSWKVKGSKGDIYVVTKDGDTWHCTCVGFGFRHQCKHLTLVKD